MRSVCFKTRFVFFLLAISGSLLVRVLMQTFEKAWLRCPPLPPGEVRLGGKLLQGHPFIKASWEGYLASVPVSY